MALPLQVWIPAALAGGFVAGKLVVGGSAGAPGDAIAGATPPDASLGGTTADPLGLGDQAGLDFGWDPTAQGGTLNGTIPGSGSGYDGGGLPGGGPVADPGTPAGTTPPPAAIPPPAPAASTAPAGATRQVVANGLTTLYTLSGGVAKPTTYQTGKHFSAWAGPAVTLRTAFGSATFAKILSGAYSGRYVHTSDPGVSFR